MPLNLYPNGYASGSVPAGWVPIPQGTIKSPVRNHQLRLYLKQLLPGKWQKVIKKGSSGDIQYLEQESGQVADVKFLPGPSAP
ncbi:MAG TPA: hypothetical protein VFF52_27925 [Isosphaeraceae bacterium]|nr:hypothetical protein [Isosphaeraceae bacterium]